MLLIACISLVWLEAPNKQLLLLPESGRDEI